MWFHEQADKGALGEIDTEQTQDGKIVMKGWICSRHFFRRGATQCWAKNPNILTALRKLMSQVYFLCLKRPGCYKQP